MPRQARVKSRTGVYHIVFRGVNKQPIFADEAEYTKFLFLLDEAKVKSGWELYAYCLMGNHLHLLVKEGQEELAQTLKRLASKYVYWFNAKNQRVGHLFQDRFLSETVEDDAYFLTVLRYIHQNPVKAGLSAVPQAYRWSSYRDYAGEPEHADTAFALSLMGQSELLEFFRRQAEDVCLDVKEQPLRVTEEEAERRFLRAVRGGKAAFATLAEPEAIEILQQLKQGGVSLRQMNRITGMSENVIRRMLGTGTAQRKAAPKPREPQPLPQRSRDVDIVIL